MVFLGLLKTDTLIARINEPPLGGDVNLYTEIKANGVTVFAERDIFADGERLYSVFHGSHTYIWFSSIHIIHFYAISEIGPLIFLCLLFI